MGCNSVGKTNILQGLTLISYLVRSNLDAIPLKIFGTDLADKFDLKTEHKEIQVALCGTDIIYCRDLTSQKVFDENLKGFIPLRTDYNINFAIGFESSAEPPLSFKNQVVNLDFHMNLNGEIFSNSLAFEYSKGNLEINHFEMDKNVKYISPEVEKLCEHITSVSSRLVEKPILAEIADKLYPVNCILQNLSFDKAYDIYSNGIRNESKQKSHPGIKFDGQGLSSTLLNIFENNPEKFKLIVEKIKVVSPELHELHVSLDKHSNEISVNTMQKIDQFERSVSIPLNLLADGMLKWYSLMTALVFAHKNIGLDEPENFLDYRMQDIFIQFIRQELEESDLVCVLATHSKTFINALTPDEILFVSSIDGKTRADRVADPERLLCRIGESGNRLGNYYETGALELFLENYDD